MAIINSGIYQNFLHSYVDISLYPFLNVDYANMASRNSTSYISVSRDGGETFELINFIDVIGGGARVISSFDFSGQYILIASRVGLSNAQSMLHLSTNYGLTFTDITPVDTTEQIRDVLIVDGRFFSFNRNESWGRISYSDNFGSSWTTLNNSTTNRVLIFPTKEAGNIIWTADGQSMATFNFASSPAVNFAYFPILSASTSGDFQMREKGFSIPPNSTNTIYAALKIGSDIKVFKNTATGQTNYTTQKTIGSTTSNPTIAAVSPTKILMEYDGLLYQSTDSGLNFTPTSFSGSTNAMLFSSANNGILSTASQTYFTTDGGSNWSSSIGTGSGGAAFMRKQK